MGLREDIIEEATALGALGVGFTNVESFAGWLEDARSLESAGAFPANYLKSVEPDPASAMPGSRSIIVCALPCREFGAARVGSPLISGTFYARRSSLEFGRGLSSYLRSRGFSSETGMRIPEKAAAVRSGIAAYGMNTLAMRSDAGSRFRITTAITDAVLDTDGASSPEVCDDCGLCVEACPTGALSENGIDACRCICHLTEKHVPVPIELRGPLGTMFLGCEECQKVCPRNEGAGVVFWEGPGMLELARRAELDLGSFNDLFEPFEYRFSSRELVLRTLALNLANSREKEAVPLLMRLSLSPDPILAECASWALEEILPS